MLGVVFERHRGVSSCLQGSSLRRSSLAGNRSRSVQQRLIRDNSGRWTINTDQLVAIRISNVGEIDLSRGGPLAHARRVLDRGAAIGNPGFVPGRGLFRAAHREANRAAIGMAGRLAIDRFGDHEAPAIVCVSQPASGVLDTWLTPHRDEQSIVELFRSGDVITPDHDMAEHFQFFPYQSHRRRRFYPTGGTRLNALGSL
jgi:hypothetical protein